ncbi:COMM domain-containing protein 10-like [Vanessa atalanta]|uniref:COMM domain-containing protein 10-like n=1 Tax=Vanessa atalanta TaxID=42275 RepID=UPI001FCDE074|nr:COMM domain-containing protein 10-like [Vanessa atalanta]
MECNWLKTSPSLRKGIDLINQLEETKFEQFLRRIVVKLKNQDTEIFTEEERRKLEKIFKVNDEQLLLAIKSILYIFKRILKFIFMPVNLKADLSNIGFNDEKVNFFIKIWSSETKLTLNDLTSTSLNKYEDNPDLQWKLNTELSSEYHKKCKVPKAYLSFFGECDVTEVELTHQELNSIFLQVESIQNELDNLM